MLVIVYSANNDIIPNSDETEPYQEVKIFAHACG